MRTKLLTLAALLLTSLSGSAADNDRQTLVVSLIDGSSIELALADTPRLAYPGIDLVIESAGFSATLPRYRVIDIHFNNAVEADAIVLPKTDAARWHIDYTQPDEVVVSGPMKGHRVSLYSAGGALIAHQAVASPTQCRIGLSGLPAGTYIISIDGVTSFKISVR